MKLEETSDVKKEQSDASRSTRGEERLTFQGDTSEKAHCQWSSHRGGTEEPKTLCSC
ncbi:hypothetical protein JOB18_008593 [Solea senegalensis]|uniref:Uncharacterized protein n=1 Tax=Solea senegalensis TaxID=28829 RepID=A0AAV6PYU6_SOLSE|nr:hypothetical protein JOB18_008593 [Solea senegalensis]